jgi:hypothetical protein
VPVQRSNAPVRYHPCAHSCYIADVPPCSSPQHVRACRSPHSSGCRDMRAVNCSPQCARASLQQSADFSPHFTATKSVGEIMSAARDSQRRTSKLLRCAAAQSQQRVGGRRERAAQWGLHHPRLPILCSIAANIPDRFSYPTQVTQRHWFPLQNLLFSCASLMAAAVSTSCSGV